MNEKSSPQEPTAQDIDRQEKARLARSFAQVFGSPANRTEAQKEVIAYLEFGNQPEENNAFRFDAKDGIGIIVAGIHRDGAQSVFRMISKQVRLADENTFVKPPKPAPKVKRS